MAVAILGTAAILLASRMGGGGPKNSPNKPLGHPESEEQEDLWGWFVDPDETSFHDSEICCARTKRMCESNPSE